VAESTSVKVFPSKGDGTFLAPKATSVFLTSFAWRTRSEESALLESPFESSGPPNRDVSHLVRGESVVPRGGRGVGYIRVKDRMGNSQVRGRRIIRNRG
jgi:hypothetical protein